MLSLERERGDRGRFPANTGDPRFEVWGVMSDVRDERLVR